MHRNHLVLFRQVQFLPVLFGISVVTFGLVRLIAGDPARILPGARATPTAITNIRAQYGLDEPMWAQFLFFLKNLGAGEMGRSTLYKIDVLRLIATRIEPTLALVVTGVAMALFAPPGRPLSLHPARHRGAAFAAVAGPSVRGRQLWP